MAADYQRPYIYAIQAPASGTTNGNLLFINTTNNSIDKTLVIGVNPTDLTINYGEDRLYIASWGENATYVVDLNMQTLLPSLNLGTDIYKINAVKAGRIITEGEDQWVVLNIIDTVAGTNVCSSYPNIREGDGETDPTGTYYYHCDNNNSDAHVHKYYIANDALTEVADGPQHAYGTRNLVLSHDGSRLFWNGYVYDGFLNELGGLGSEIYACSSNGAAAFGSSQVFDMTTRLAFYNLPVSASVVSVDGLGQRFWYFNSATNTIESIPMAGIQNPAITQQSTNQIIYSGNNAMINISATGLSPMAYLWFFNRTNFSVTPNGQMVVSNFQASNAGSYSVVVTNAYGSAVSSNVLLTVVYAAPNINGQPTSVMAVAGANAAFSVNVNGSLPMNFQWQFGGTNVTDGTNATLTLTNLQLANQGGYDVVISNAYGSTTSSNAVLTLADIAGALNTTNLAWTSSGDMTWFVQTNPASGDLWGFGYPATHDGISSMQSGNTTAGQQSILSTIVNGPATLSFWWQTASISSSDFLTFSLNGQGQSSIGRNNYWQQQTFYVGVGTNLLVWDYETDADPLNRAEAWLDQVSIAPGGTPPFVTVAPVGQIVSINSNATMNVTANGTPPFTYQWRFNGTNIDGATNAALTLSNLRLADAGYYDAVIGNGFGATNSSSAYLNVVDPVAALNATNLTWSSGGDVPWFVQTANTYDGFAAMQSGTVVAGQQSTLQTTVTGPGTLTFWWAAYYCSAYNPNYLGFAVNGVEQSRCSSGFLQWSQQTIYLGDGVQTLQWVFYEFNLGDCPAATDHGLLDEVNFIPGGTAPFLTLNPSNQVVLLGSNATLNASALGTPPLYYQWQLNLTNVDGATNASLALTNMQFANEGNYTLVVSNEYGVTNTTAVYVNVVDFTESLNATNLIWSSSGDQSWFPETSITHDGIAALQSGAITGNQQSTVQTTVTGPGTLSFWWMVSSETNNDYVNCSVDGSELFRISGTVNWQQITYSVAAGTHTLTWSYSKNATINKGSDAAWLDQVNYVPGATPPVITVNLTNQIAQIGQAVNFQVGVLGTPPLTYQWQFNGTNISGATNSTLNLPPWSGEGTYSVIISNAYGTAVSSNATLTTPRSQIVPWEVNYHGEIIIPGGLGNVVAIAAGGYDSMALKSDGTVVVWGYDGGHGQTHVPAGLSNVVAIACGSLYDCLALKSDGTVIGWGDNTYSKATAPAGLSNVVAIATGDNHSVILQNNGKIVAWGSNSSGQTNVPASLTNAVAIAAGSAHSLALRSNGTVVAWGDNSSGQTNLPASLTNVTAIAACGNDCLALQSNGTVVAWGSNSSHQTNVPAGLTNVIAIAAGTSHNLALRNDGTVIAWGSNAQGQTNVPVGLGKVVAIAAGQTHSLALLSDGPLLVTGQPLNQTNYAGFPITFTANVLGLRPIVYQWQLNGTNIIGATNSSLTLMNVQPTNAGNYSVIFTNSYGTIASSNATLTVIAIPPTLVLQPTNCTVFSGSNVTFTATAGVGPVPITYQWQFNGTNINWATNASLTLTNVQLTNQGSYDIVASNNFGGITSSNAFLLVLDLPTALDATGLTWTNTGVTPWFAEATTTHDGVEAAQSGLVANGQKSILQTAVTGPGTLTFWWMFSPLTPPFPNSLSFSTSQSNNAASVSSTSGWQQKTFYLGAGTQTLGWTYSRFSFVSGQSTGYVDQVSFIPGGTAPIITNAPVTRLVRANANTSFTVGAAGTPPLVYQWQFNQNSLTNQTNATLTLLNVQPTNSGNYSVTITNNYGSLSTNAALSVEQFVLNTSPTNLWMTTNGFQLQLDGILTANPVVILESTDLVSWLPIYTNPATTGSIQLLDFTATNLPARFYRAQE